MKLFMYAYKNGSRSAKALSGALGIKRIKNKNSKFRPRNKVVVNWGSSSVPPDIQRYVIILNRPESVKVACNKLTAFLELADNGVPTPGFTQDINTARGWVDMGYKVFCRTNLTGHSGQGIVIASTPEELVDAHLYTKWSRIENEYRIHVFKGQVIDKQRKARKKAVPDDKVNWKIRNTAGGFIFARGDCNPEEGIEQAALEAVEALDLEFGAVDVIYTKKGEVMVLEVNTACGLEGTTLENYTKAIKNYVGDYYGINIL